MSIMPNHLDIKVDDKINQTIPLASQRISLLTECKFFVSTLLNAPEVVKSTSPSFVDLVVSYIINLPLQAISQSNSHKSWS